LERGFTFEYRIDEQVNKEQGTEEQGTEEQGRGCKMNCVKE
jgi:hypothetical protein